MLSEAATMLCESRGVDAAKWDLKAGFGEEFVEGNLIAVEYLCRNCKRDKRTVMGLDFRWSTTFEGTVFEKMGRSPKFEVEPPKELGDALGEHADSAGEAWSFGSTTMDLVRLSTFGEASKTPLE